MTEASGGPRPNKLWTSMELIRVTADFFAEKGIASPRLDAELLLAHVLDVNRLQLYLDHDRPLVPAELDRFRELVRERGKRVPLQLLMGEVEILEHEFEVRAGVFIPRPETEVLIERCRGLEFVEGAPRTVVEIGVGSGCIGLSLVTYWPGARLIGYDVNDAAVVLTRHNAVRLGVTDRVELHHADGLAGEALPVCELLVSNPPYVPRRELATLEPEVRDHDPREALDGGDDGLDAVRALSERGFSAVRPGGWIALEHGHDQGESVPAILRRDGWTDVLLHRDLADRPRVTVARRPD